MQRQPEPDHQRDARAGQGRADQLAAGRARVERARLLAEGDALHDGRQIRRRVGQRQHEHRQHDQRAAQGDPVRRVAVDGRRRPFSGTGAGRIGKEGVRDAADHAAEDDPERQRAGQRGHQPLLGDAGHRDQREGDDEDEGQRAGRATAEKEQRVKDAAGEQDAGRRVVFEQRHHQHAGGDQPGEHGAGRQALERRHRRPRLAQHEHRHQADDVGQRQRRAVGDGGGQPEADGQPQHRLVRRVDHRLLSVEVAHDSVVSPPPVGEGRG